MNHPGLLYPLVLSIFSIGYLAIIFEHALKVNKTAVALVIAVLCWSVYFVCGPACTADSMNQFQHHLSDVSQIIFFLLGAMTLVELIDAHKGFSLVTKLIATSSKTKMLWLVSVSAFFLSAILDNLTTTILMISLLKKLIPDFKDRLLLSCIVVVAANAGGAWTPIGDVTTTMLWINGQISASAVIKSLLLPSIISLVVPLLYFSSQFKGHISSNSKEQAEGQEPGAALVLFTGVLALVFVPIFKTLTGLPPFMGMILGLGALWLLTDFIHRNQEDRKHLSVPTVLSKIDTSGILFFLGILLCVNALESAGILNDLALILDRYAGSKAMIATVIGVLSAIIDNVPLVAGTIGMYPISEYPMDSSFWHMIAYAAGTGGSMLLIGSSAGVALMGLEKVDFVTYMKKMTLPVFIGYLCGMGVYLALH